MEKIEDRLKQIGLKWKKRRWKVDPFPRSYVESARKLEKRIMNFDEMGNITLKEGWLRKTSLNDRIFIDTLFDFLFEKKGTLHIEKPELFYQKMNLGCDMRVNKKMMKMVAMRYEKNATLPAIFKVDFRMDKVKAALKNRTKDMEQMMELFSPGIELERVFFLEEAERKAEEKILYSFEKNCDILKESGLKIDLKHWLLPAIIEEFTEKNKEEV